jgi:hypothetical protein
MPMTGLPPSPLELPGSNVAELVVVDAATTAGEVCSIPAGPVLPKSGANWFGCMV